MAHGPAAVSSTGRVPDWPGAVAGNPPVPVTYSVKTDDIQFWGISLNMKYQF